MQANHFAINAINSDGKQQLTKFEQQQEKTTEKSSRNNISLCIE